MQTNLLVHLNACMELFLLKWCLPEINKHIDKIYVVLINIHDLFRQQSIVLVYCYGTAAQPNLTKRCGGVGLS